MANMLGMMAAGAAKGYTQQRVSEIDAQNKFNMQQELMNAQAEKELMLKKAGYKLEDEREQAKKDRIKSIADGVKQTGEVAGESQEEKAKRQRGLLQSKADALSDAGEFDAAESYYKRVDANNKNDISLAQLDMKKQQLEGMIANWEEKNKNAQETNRIREELGDAKNATQLALIQAKIESINAATERKRAAGEREYKPTEGDKTYQSYVDEMKSSGKKPLARYQFENWMDSKKAGFKSDSNFEDVSTKTIKTDKRGNPIEEQTIKRKQPIKQKEQAAKKIGRYVVGKGIVYD